MSSEHQAFNTQSAYTWILFVVFSVALTLMLNSFIQFSASEATAVRANQVARQSALYGGALLKTSAGTIEIDFYKTKAPITVSNFIQLARDDFYDGTKFHRLMPGLYIQGGDPLTRKTDDRSVWGTGGPGYTLEKEAHDVLMTRGVVAMMNEGSKVSGSQFFILTADRASWLDGQHTVFARVVDGRDVVDHIAKTPTDANNVPIEPVLIRNVILR